MAQHAIPSLQNLQLSADVAIALGQRDRAIECLEQFLKAASEPAQRWDVMVAECQLGKMPSRMTFLK